MDGNTAAIAYTRSTSPDVKIVGYGDFSLYQGENTVDFGDEGCMTGYRLAFEQPATASRLLNTEAFELRGMSAVSNPSLQGSVSQLADEDTGSVVA